jgi:hypothetical protein
MGADDEILAKAVAVRYEAVECPAKPRPNSGPSVLTRTNGDARLSDRQVRTSGVQWVDTLSSTTWSSPAG